MRLCIASSVTDDSSISPDSTVNEAMLKIATKLKVSDSSVYVIYQGQVLRKEKQLKEYGITNSSLLHVVLSFSPCKCIVTEKKLGDDDCSKSNAMFYSEPKLSNPDELVIENDAYGEPIIASLFFHIFGDSLYNIKEECESTGEIPQVDPDITIMKSALQTPFFQDVLSDISFVRKLVLANDDIIEITKTNPGLLEFINNDESLQDVINVISDTNGYQDFHHLRNMVLRKIETALGNQLKITEENYPLPSETINKKPPPPIPSQKILHKGDKRCSESVCREEHIALLCQIAANRPDIVKAFMKRTPMYKKIATKRPDLLNELLKPERLQIIASPEMVHSLIKLDDAIRRANGIL